MSVNVYDFVFMSVYMSLCECVYLSVCSYLCECVHKRVIVSVLVGLIFCVCVCLWVSV